ncbi:siroheme synthase CysG [Hyphomicrobiales bacterium 4NK60-0047b]
MRYFPIYYDMQNTSVAIIGGGEEAAQKLRLLKKTPAEITVFATSLNAELEDSYKNNLIKWQREEPSEENLEPFSLIYAASDEDENEKIAQIAYRLKTPLNVVDAPDLCNFITPAIVDRAPITVAIGSEGTAPVLARMIKTKIEALLSTDIGNIAKKAQSLRHLVAKKYTSFEQRRNFWDHLFKDVFAGATSATIYQNALDDLSQKCETTDTAKLGAPKETSKGFVSLVGAGPGPSDLLTFRAARALQSADVVIYDRLIDPTVLEIIRRDARRIFVGKTPGEKCTSQDEINDHILNEANKGLRVVRLKCGDPLIFGRAGEEMDAMKEAGIEFEIIPGITAANACAAEANLPLTIRKDTRALIYLTGHSAEGLTPYKWASFATKGVMLVLYMGVKMAPKIQANLLAVGASPKSKISIIENGCKEGSRTFTSTLGRLSQEIKHNSISNPAIILISVERQMVSIDESSREIVSVGEDD